MAADDDTEPGDTAPAGEPAAARDPAAASFARLVELSGSSVDPAAVRARRGRSSSRQVDQPPNRRRWSGARSSPRDPQQLGDAFAALAKREGWSHGIQRGRVLSEWSAVVGPELAAKTEPVSLTDGELVIAAASTAWATELRMMSRVLLERIERIVGAGVVTRIVIRGPAAPSWKKGPRSVRGRGPRDTYG